MKVPAGRTLVVRSDRRVFLPSRGLRDGRTSLSLPTLDADVAGRGPRRLCLSSRVSPRPFVLPLLPQGYGRSAMLWRRCWWREGLAGETARRCWRCGRCRGAGRVAERQTFGRLLLRLVLVVCQASADFPSGAG